MTLGTASGKLKGRDNTIETKRGIACLLVVIFHVIGLESTGLRMPAGSGWREFTDLLAYVHMPLFAFIGGLVYSLKPVTKDNHAQFLRSRALRLGVPFLVVSSLYALALKLPFQYNIPNPENLWEVYFLPFAHLWYLPAFAWCLLYLSMADRFGATAHPKWLWALLIVSAGLFFVPGLPPQFGIKQSLFLFPFVLAGAATQRFGLIHHRLALPVGALIALGGFALATAEMTGFLTLDHIQLRVLRLVVGISASFTVMALPFQQPVLTTIGLYSYPIYLYHVFGINAVRRPLMALGFDEPSVHIAVGVVAGVVLPILFVLLVLRYQRYVNLPLSLALFGQPRKPVKGEKVEERPTTTGVTPTTSP